MKLKSLLTIRSPEELNGKDRLVAVIKASRATRAEKTDAEKTKTKTPKTRRGVGLFAIKRPVEGEESPAPVVKADKPARRNLLKALVTIRQPVEAVTEETSKAKPVVEVPEVKVEVVAKATPAPVMAPPVQAPIQAPVQASAEAPVQAPVEEPAQAPATLVVETKVTVPVPPAPVAPPAPAPVVKTVVRAKAPEVAQPAQPIVIAPKPVFYETVLEWKASPIGSEMFEAPERIWKKSPIQEETLDDSEFRTAVMDELTLDLSVELDDVIVLDPAELLADINAGLEAETGKMFDEDLAKTVADSKKAQKKAEADARAREKDMLTRYGDGKRISDGVAKILAIEPVKLPGLVTEAEVAARKTDWAAKAQEATDHRNAVAKLGAENANRTAGSSKREGAVQGFKLKMFG